MRALVLALLGSSLVTSVAVAQGPASLTEPGDRTLFSVNAGGVQVYECRVGASGAPAWAFKEPRADLTVNGEPFGRHYAGPTWEHLDGSRITGRAVATLAAPSPGDIPWLRLAVAAHAEAGTMDPVAAVQRVETHGGVSLGPLRSARHSARRAVHRHLPATGPLGSGLID